MKEKIYKSMLFLRGFMRMSTMVIVFILLVTYYFYQDKIKEIASHAYQNNKENGAIFYATGIWDKMKSVQKRQEERSQNALDLAGNTKTIQDKKKLYSIEIPENWVVTTDQDQVGKQLSRLVVSNKIFSERNIASDIFYDNGAQLSIQVLSEELSSAKNADGNHGKMLVEKKSSTIGNGLFNVHVITDPKVKNGKIIDAHVLHGGKTFEIRFVYNAEKFAEGEFVFGEIMNSFKFTDKK